MVVASKILKSGKKASIVRVRERGFAWYGVTTAKGEEKVWLSFEEAYKIFKDLV